MSDGIYDQVCEGLLEETEALLTCVLVIEGKLGTGFSVSTSSEAVLDKLPEILESLADGVRKGNKSVDIKKH